MIELQEKQQEQNFLDQQDLFDVDVLSRFKNELKKLEVWSGCQQSEKYFEQILFIGLKETAEEAKAILKDSKVYIIVQSISSSGNGTLINSLLGQNLLPSQKRVDTTQHIFIKYSDSLRVNGQKLQNQTTASEHILRLQNEASQYILIETPSIFPQELVDLRSRVIFIDKLPLTENNSDTSKLDCIRPLDLVIHLVQLDVTVSNYELKQTYISLKERLCKVQNPNESSENFWFIINKRDTEQIFENSSSQVIFENIQKTFGKQAHIFIISTSRKQIDQNNFISMLLKNQSSQQKQNPQEQGEYCQNFFQFDGNQENQNEQYKKLLNLIITDIKVKFNNKFKSKVNEFRAFDQCLSIFKLEKLSMTKPTPKDEQSVQSIFAQLERFGKKSQELSNIMRETLGKYLNEIYFYFNGFEQIKQFCFPKRANEFLNLMQLTITNQINKNHEDYAAEAQILYQNIQHNLSLITLTEDEKLIIIVACQKVFNYFLTSKTKIIKEKTNQFVNECLNECLTIATKNQQNIQELRQFSLPPLITLPFIGLIPKKFWKVKVFGSSAVIIATVAQEFHIFYKQQKGNKIILQKLQVFENLLNQHLQYISENFIETQKNFQKLFDCILKP